MPKPNFSSNAEETNIHLESPSSFNSAQNFISEQTEAFQNAQYKKTEQNNPAKKVHTQDCCNSPGGCGNCMKGGMPMKKEVLSFITLLMIGVTTVLAVLLVNEKRSQISQSVTTPPESKPIVSMKYELPQLKAVREVVKLPSPKLRGNTSLEETIQNRRSRRYYSDEAVTMQELSQILWSAQGITDDAGHRAAPSARSAYPFNLYVVVRNVENVDEGLYLYNPEDHSLGNLGLVNAGDRLIEAGVQDNSQKSPVVIALVASPAKMLEKSPDSDPLPNIYLEGGHIGQNVYLQVEALDMATVVTGGFNKQAVANALELDSVNETVVYLIPFGNVGVAPTEEETH